MILLIKEPLLLSTSEVTGPANVHHHGKHTRVKDTSSEFLYISPLNVITIDYHMLAINPLL